MSRAANTFSQLQECKALYGNADAATRTETLLKQIRRLRFTSTEDLFHLHETLLFLRAYPPSEGVARLCDEILFTYGRRLRGLSPAERKEFEYAEVSGIAGTGLTTNFSYVFARSLADRHAAKSKRGAKSRMDQRRPSALQADLYIDWDQFPRPDRLAPILAGLIPEAREDWAVGRHADWRKRYESAGGNIRWLLDRVRPEVYDLLEIPVRFELGDSDASRSRARIPRRSIFYHDHPLLGRRDVSLAAEFATAPIRVKIVSRPRATYILGVIVDASAVRYRELYGFEYPDAARVFHADLGRGMDLFFCGVARHWRLPHREYCAGMYFKNGVPMGYVEVLWVKGVMEVGFNLYYTFRQGETAWVYARLLKLFRQQFDVDTFTIDPYQLGHENEEAIESGAFWFYSKLGFVSQSKRIRHLVKREQHRIAASPTYRTPPRILELLAEAPMIYHV